MSDQVAVWVYVGTYGTYKVPADVMANAVAANAGKRLTDGRTRGAKIINAWGRCHDKKGAA